MAVVDLDYHHGNGTQEIFYRRRDALTVSIHAEPRVAYPHFSGYADETGEGPGRGFNRNFPLPDGAGDRRYLAALDEALVLIRRFGPAALIVGLGFDTMAGDPVGSLGLTTRAMGEVGRRIGDLNVPVLVVQEGGYDLGNLRRGGGAVLWGTDGAGAGSWVRSVFPARPACGCPLSTAGRLNGVGDVYMARGEKSA